MLRFVFHMFIAVKHLKLCITGWRKSKKKQKNKERMRETDRQTRETDRQTDRQTDRRERERMTADSLLLSEPLLQVNYTT